MIPRYSLPEISELFSDEARFSNWLEVELLATESWSQLGVVPAKDAEAARKKAPKIDAKFVSKVNEREEITNHDVAAFVDVVQNSIGGSAGKWIHYGLTSSDVVDTAQCLAITRAIDVLLSAVDQLISTLKQRAEEFRNTPQVGRTHGIHAEPTTFGVKLALWCLQVARDRDRLIAAREMIAVAKLSGAVGTYSNIDPQVEQYVAEKLKLKPVASTQVVARDRHAEVMYACTSLGTTIETIATEVRHLQRTEVGEVLEPFAKGQKGSSAMPHKRNPILAERLSGLARILRGNLQAALENVALWHERDISHSSVERVIIPETFELSYYMTVKATSLINGMNVNDQRMRDNFDASYGLVFSQPVLLALVAKGMSRDDAYRIVQRNALSAWEEKTPFRGLVEADSEVALSTEDLDRAFDIDRALSNIDQIFKRLEELS